MSSFLRSLFTHNHTQSTTPGPAPTSQGKTKSHSRSSSLPAVSGVAPTGSVPPNYIYAPPSGKAASSSYHSQPTRKRSRSYVASSRPPPSPLRFATYNSSRTYAGSQTSQSESSRPPMPRGKSHGRGSTDHMHSIPYAIYTPSVSFSSSSRSCSNSSIRMPPRTSSSHSVPRHSFEMRPPLKQNHTWHGENDDRGRERRRPSTAPQNHISAVEIHPLLASVRSKKAAIGYDITYLPSPRSVLDRHTRSAVPESTLLQPATCQPITSKLILRSHKFPWAVTVSPTQTKSKPTFYIGSSSSSLYQQPNVNPITILDVLNAVHVSLNVPIAQQEWDELGQGSKAQRKITKAYQARCTKMGGGWEGGVRRIDWLGAKTRLVGLEVDSSSPDGRTCSLVFSKA